MDGAIHRRGGPEIMRDTDARYPQGCPTGSAVISAAGKLSAKYVIHAVGPVWSGGQRGEADLLAGAYRRSLELAVEQGCRSIAMPALSTGAYRYPMGQAARVAIATSISFLRQHGRPELIRFVLFDAGAYGAFAAAPGRVGERGRVIICDNHGAKIRTVSSARATVIAFAARTTTMSRRVHGRRKTSQRTKVSMIVLIKTAMNQVKKLVAGLNVPQPNQAL